MGNPFPLKLKKYLQDEDILLHASGKRCGNNWAKMIDEDFIVYPLIDVDRIRVLTDDRLQDEPLPEYFYDAGKKLSDRTKAQWE